MDKSKMIDLIVVLLIAVGLTIQLVSRTHNGWNDKIGNLLVLAALIIFTANLVFGKRKEKPKKRT